jgi:hypothetical protein
MDSVIAAWTSLVACSKVIADKAMARSEKSVVANMMSGVFDRGDEPAAPRVN